MKSRRLQIRAQTILELVHFAGLLSIFLGVSWYLFTAFEVLQKQTMLVRTQAFIELGNYSDFGTTKHGQDNPTSDQSVITFQLGERTAGTRVDLTKADSFKKAVEGELKLDVRQIQQDDNFWLTFNFPRRTVRLDYSNLSEEQNGSFEMILEQPAFIVHGRTIEPSKAPNFFANQKNSFATGSVRFEEALRLTQLTVPALKAGMRDNMTVVQDALREIAKADLSLAAEAESLSKSVSASEAISGGAAASLIQTAISWAIAGVLDGLSNLSSAGEAGASAAGATGPSSFMDQLVGNFTNPFAGASAVMNGSFLSAPIDTITGMISVPLAGIQNFTGGLANLGGDAHLTAAGGSVITSQQAWMVGLKGASQIGQTVQLGAAIGGQDIAALNKAVVVTAFPSDLNLGFKALDSAWNSNPTSFGGGDILGAMQALPQVVIPTTTVVSVLAPELAEDMGYVNLAVTAAAASAGLADNAGDFIGGDKKLDFSNLRGTSEGLQELGKMTMLAGSAYSGIAMLTDNDPTVGEYLMMGGTGMMVAGKAGEVVADYRDRGINILNPVGAAKEIGKWAAGLPQQNVDNLKSSIGNLRDTVSGAIDTTTMNVNIMFAPGDEKKVLQQQYKQDMYAAWQKNLKFHEGSEEFLKGSGLAKNDAELKALQDQVRGDMKTLDEGIQHVRNVRAGRATKDPAKVEAAMAAGERLNGQMNQWFKEVPLAKRQTKGVYYGNAQAQIHRKAERDGVGRSEVKDMEEVARDRNPVGHFFGSLRGGRNTAGIYNKQEQLARDLARTQQIKQTIIEARDEKVKEIDRVERARSATKMAGRVLENAPIWSKDHGAMKDNAAQASSLIRSVAEDKSIELPSYERVRMQNAARKLDRIANGDYDAMTGRQVIESIREDLRRREAFHRNLKNAVVDSARKSNFFVNQAAYVCAAQGEC